MGRGRDIDTMTDKAGFRWAFAGCKPQGAGILSALGQDGFVPDFCAVPTDLADADDAEMHSVASHLSVPVYRSQRLEELEHRLAALDLLLVCRFALLPPAIFTAPRLGAVNVHSSLLPRYRGVHPVSWALINGETETGVTLHRIGEGADTGPILSQSHVAIDDNDDLWSLTAKLNAVSASSVLHLFNGIAATGDLPAARPQAGRPSMAPRRTPDDSRIDWAGAAQTISNLVRALPVPLPAAFCFAGDGRRVEIRSARLCAPCESLGVPGQVVQGDADGVARVLCGDGRCLDVIADHSLAAGDVLT